MSFYKSDVVKAFVEAGYGLPLKDLINKFKYRLNQENWATFLETVHTVAEMAKKVGKDNESFTFVFLRGQRARFVPWHTPIHLLDPSGLERAIARKRWGGPICMSLTQLPDEVLGHLVALLGSKSHVKNCRATCKVLRGAADAVMKTTDWPQTPEWPPAPPVTPLPPPPSVSFGERRPKKLPVITHLEEKDLPRWPEFIWRKRNGKVELTAP